MAGLGAVNREGAAVAGAGTNAKVVSVGNGVAAIVMNASRGEKQRQCGRQQCQNF